MLHANIIHVGCIQEEKAGRLKGGLPRGVYNQPDDEETAAAVMKCVARRRRDRIESLRRDDVGPRSTPTDAWSRSTCHVPDAVTGGEMAGLKPVSATVWHRVTIVVVALDPICRRVATICPRCVVIPCTASFSRSARSIRGLTHEDDTLRVLLFE